jgi:hypothetical protein
MPGRVPKLAGGSLKRGNMKKGGRRLFDLPLGDRDEFIPLPA